MSELLNSNTFGDKIYNRFPEVYRRDDRDVNYSLKRYIQTAGDGFKCAIDEVNGISDLRDNIKVPSEFLPYVYSSHGLEIFNGIPDKFLRNLIPTLNTTFSRKGSISAVEYLCSVISGVSCTVDMSNFADNNKINLAIDMDFNLRDDFPNIKQLQRIVFEFVPFYCNVHYVFLYKFEDSFSISMADFGWLDKVEDFNHRLIGINIEEKDEYEISQTFKDEYLVDNRSYQENTNFLNDPRLCLSNNITLNSWNGYDIIKVNGTVIDISTYDYVE